VNGEQFAADRWRVADNRWPMAGSGEQAVFLISVLLTSDPL